MCGRLPSGRGPDPGPGGFEGQIGGQEPGQPDAGSLAGEVEAGNQGSGGSGRWSDVGGQWSVVGGR